MYDCARISATGSNLVAELCYTASIKETNSTMTSLTLTLPDDWHIHLRDEAALSTTVPDIARWAGRAIVMPNLKEPVRTVGDALAYRQRILAARPPGSHFDPLMTLYLTDSTTAESVAEAAQSEFVQGIKLYPAGATTNSAAGVTALKALYPVIEAMQKHDLPLLIHGEVTDADCDIFDREKAFIDTALMPLTERFPALRIVFEHITTRDAVQFVEAGSDRIAATVTASANAVKAKLEAELAALETRYAADVGAARRGQRRAEPLANFAHAGHTGGADARHHTHQGDDELLAEAQLHAENLSEKKHRDTLVECGSVLVRAGANGQHEPPDARGNAEVLLRNSE